MSVQTQSQNVQTSQYLLKLMTNSILSTLQIFGFDIKTNEKEHKIQFNASIFSRPNQKAFEVIVQFLLCQIDPERAEKTFNQCWPIILKEQQKDFKDSVLNWLLELSQKGIKNNEKPQAISQIVQQYQNVLQLIRFPIITKSLLMTPGGLKICELLFALCQYALIVNLARLIENHKLNIRIPPKVSPFVCTETGKQPFTQAQTTNTNSNLTSKIVTQKQMNNYETLVNSLKHRVDLDLNEFHQYIFKLADIRTKWQQSSQVKTTNIRTLVDKKIHLTQTLARKKALLARQLNVKDFDTMDENSIRLETLYDQFKQVKLSQFENNWLKFKKINDESLDNEFNKENIDCLTSNSNPSDTKTSRKLQLDGQDFIKSILNQNESNPKEFEDKILKFIYENMDRNSSIRNAEVGPLFSEDGQQLDLINLFRLYNLVLILNGELMSKIDREKLEIFVNLLNSLSQTEDSELVPIDEDSSQKSQLGGIFKGNKIINDDSVKLKTKLDAFIPKIKEYYKILLEKEVVKADIPISPNRDDVSRHVREFIKEYFNLTKSSLNLKTLQYLREKRQMELSAHDDNNSLSLSQNNSDDYQPQVKSAKKSIKFSNDFNNSFELLDLQDSNMDLI